MLSVGQTFETEVAVTQHQIDQFATLSGDKNPIHIDAEYASGTKFKSTIAHGIWAGAIFSRYLGMDFPGPGSIYLSQQLDFKRPVYPGKSYKVVLAVTEIDQRRNTGLIKTSMFDAQTNKICVDGVAKVMFPTK